MSMSVSVSVSVDRAWAYLLRNQELRPPFPIFFFAQDSQGFFTWLWRQFYFLRDFHQGCRGAAPAIFFLHSFSFSFNTGFHHVFV